MWGEKRLSKQERNEQLEPDELQLIEAIKKAFAGSRYPGDENLVWDKNDWEGSRVYFRWKGRRWTKVPIRVVVETRDELWCFSIAGFRYYLPACLIAAVRYSDWVDVLTIGLEVRLTPPSEARGCRDFSEFVKLLTLAQKKTILSYLCRYEHSAAPDSDRLRAIQFWRQEIAREEAKEKANAG